MRLVVRPAVTLAAVASAALAVAVAFEAPRTFKAAELLKPSQVKGPHFTVAPTVKTDGYLHVFDATSDYGPFEAEGRSTLLTRLQEVGASPSSTRSRRARCSFRPRGRPW